MYGTIFIPINNLGVHYSQAILALKKLASTSQGDNLSGVAEQFATQF